MYCSVVLAGSTKEVTKASLFIKNPTDKKIAFKVKITEPGKYAVRPNSKVLYPREATRVLSTLINYKL